MKKVFSTLIMAIGFVGFISASNTPASITVDATKSVISWKAYKVTGSHEGTISLNSGELLHTDGRLSGGTFDINMSSIAVTDLEGGMKGKLEGHLKSPDFFSVEEFPTGTLNITNVTSRGKVGEYKITADLTLKGITKPIKFNAVEEGGTFTADITVDRAEYNVRYGSGSFFDNLGDKTIYDEFELTVSLVTSK
jgi:polyisoprenoid-binding protein YceI